jgi:hypothetical protein
MAAGKKANKGSVSKTKTPQKPKNLKSGKKAGKKK